VIVGSLLLILVAVTLLVLGLGSGSSGLLIGSIAASLLAAVALVVGARQAAATRGGLGGGEPLDDTAAPHDGGEGPGDPRPRRPPTNPRVPPTEPRMAGPTPPASAGEAVVTEPLTASVPTQTIRSGEARDDTGWRPPAGDAEQAGATPATTRADTTLPQDAVSPVDDGVLADEPPAQRVSTADAARVARLTAEVHVVDGRPRYHLPDCTHLAGREAEPLPVREAVELGFTPCGRCEPDSALLADASRS
jgi:hypothetical protein